MLGQIFSSKFSFQKTISLLDALISQIYFWNKTLHVSDSSSVHHQEFFTVQIAMVYVIQFCCQQTCMTYTTIVLDAGAFMKSTCKYNGSASFPYYHDVCLVVCIILLMSLNYNCLKPEEHNVFKRNM